MCINTNVLQIINYVTKLTKIININKFNYKYIIFFYSIKLFFTKAYNKKIIFVINNAFSI